MPNTFNFQALMAGALMLLGTAAQAQNFPGEDPVQINSPVTYEMAPNPIIRQSSDINMQTGLSGSDQAKITRYTAMAYAPQPKVLTEKDAVNSVQTKGLYTTCVQSVGSNLEAPTGAAAVLAQPQVVVLRGDLVNICN